MQFKEGQTYICTSTTKPWWTVGKEYEVKRHDDYGLCIFNDDGDWYTQKKCKSQSYSIQTQGGKQYVNI